MTAGKAWECHLLKSSPHYDKWRGVLGTDEVPLVSPRSHFANLGPEFVEVYALDLKALDAAQFARLVDFCVKSFGASAETVKLELAERGFPVRAADVVVARFFAA